VAAVQRLQTGGVSANDLAKELGVSIWSLRRWSRQYRKRKAAGAGAAREPAAAPKELAAKPSSEPVLAPPLANVRSFALRPKSALFFRTLLGLRPELSRRVLGLTRTVI
jgi:transposase-like protein